MVYLLRFSNITHLSECPCSAILLPNFSFSLQMHEYFAVSATNYDPLEKYMWETNVALSIEFMMRIISYDIVEHHLHTHLRAADGVNKTCITVINNGSSGNKFTNLISHLPPSIYADNSMKSKNVHKSISPGKGV